MSKNIDNDDSALFSNNALKNRQKKFGKVVRPINHLSWRLIFLMVALIVIFVIGVLFYEVEKKVKIQALSLLQTKPANLIAHEQGTVTETLLANGSDVKKNQPIVRIKSNEFCEKQGNVDCNMFDLLSPTNGRLERFYLAVGDVVNVNQIYGIIVPKKKNVKFESHVSVELLPFLSLGDEFIFQLSNKYLNDKEEIPVKLSYIADLPEPGTLNLSSDGKYKLEFSPIIQTDIPVGSRFLGELVVSKISILEVLN